MNTGYLTFEKYIKLIKDLQNVKDKEKDTNTLSANDISFENFNKNTMAIIHHIVNCIAKAENDKSKIDNLTDEGKEILEYNGYTGTHTRHFYNNICNTSNVRYLEIGTWNGSSSISATYKNNIDALFIDNWSQFNGSSEIFEKAIKKYGKTSRCSLLESDCWTVDLSTIENTFNVYLYDGAHAELDHFKALEYYLPVLDNEFIFLVDDFTWADVRDGTMRAIRELGLTIKFRHEIFMSPDDLKGMPNHKGKETWWNGIAVFLLEKPKNV